MNFDLNNTPLQKGASLIEASAGTGKTYTIAGMFLRLLLEENIPIQQILVVTYTNAATEELRTRVRAMLREAAQAFATGTSKIPFLQAFYVKHEAAKSRIMETIDRALRSFDEAAIYSIHGFCQRMLKDRAFESGVHFDTELATDVSNLLQEVSDDYWRKNFYPGNPIKTSFALKNGFSPQRFLPWLQDCLNYPFIRFASEVDGTTLDQVTAELEAKLEHLKHIWNRDKVQLKQLFGSHQKKAWANKPYNNDEKVAEFFLSLEKCFTSSTDVTDLKNLTHFCNSSLLDGTGKNKTPPQHPFFDACDELCRSEAQFATALQVDFLKFALAELPRRKDQLKVQSFDDLLTRLRSALKSGYGENLAREIRSRYRAALIDEFQDTDPIQYDIFQSIFSSDDHYLFLIGDPKQAIYGFRGADIFTYIKAAEAAARKFTLSKNWRSESGLVAAINTIFSQAETPFVFPQISFAPVEAKGEADKEALRCNGEALAPFELWFYPRLAGKPISKDVAEAELPRIVAAEISRLLHDDVRMGERRVRPEDIAVLVIENRQAQLMQDALSDLGIPSVQQTTASLFESHEADEVHRVLLSILQPTNEKLLKAALATDILGLTATNIVGLDDSNPLFHAYLESFHRYFDLWMQSGFIQMFREFLRKENVRPRLLSFADGERRLTNLLHLGEVLHCAALEQKLGGTALVKWLVDQKSQSNTRDEEYQLRLERDENAVKLVTVHRSKGLEYGIVFCPFSWKHSEIGRGGQDQVLFHDRATGDLIRDLGSASYDGNRELALEEKLAENLRLLYVALTRAKHRCYFVWGHFNKAQSSAPAWLFHGKALKSAAEKELRFLSLSDDAMLQDLQSLQRSTPEKVIEIRDLPSATALPYEPESITTHSLAARQITTRINSDWRVASFSSLSKHVHDEPLDHDERENASTQPFGGIFAFPNGTRPGTCLHEIFEQWNFNEPNTELLRDLVSEKLIEHALSDDEFCGPVCEMVQKVLSVPLASSNGTFKLGDLPRQDRLSEMEFYFPLQKISPVTLRSLFARHQSPETAPEGRVQIGKLTFDPVCGYIKGFIDLVFRHDGKFYILDWKSNRLGNRVEDYDTDSMFSEMVAMSYFVQSHLYTLALHQYLTHRVPGYDYTRDFGGVLYVFLRGVDPQRPQYGVYRNRPSNELLADLARELIRQNV